MWLRSWGRRCGKRAVALHLQPVFLRLFQDPVEAGAYQRPYQYCNFWANFSPPFKCKYNTETGKEQAH